MNKLGEYADLSYAITGAVYEVRKQLGCGFLESVYRKALAYELQQQSLKAEQEAPIKILYKGVDLDMNYYADILVEDRVIIELKTVKAFDDVHRAQIIHYLKATGIKFGMLVNFGNKSAEIERFVYE